MSDIRKGVVDPGLTQVLKEFRTDIFANINCIQIGQIQSFNSSNQTATIQLLVKRIKDPATGEIISYPILADCPVYFPGGTSSYISFPVSKGDECIVLFNDRDIDNWFVSGNESIPNTIRMHNLSDAFALVGVRSLTKSISGMDSAELKLNNSAINISLKSDKAAIANSSGDFYTIMNQLFDALINAVTVSGGPFEPGTISAITAAKNAFATVFQAGS